MTLSQQLLEIIKDCTTIEQVRDKLSKVELSEYKIAHILSGIDGIGGYTPKELALAKAIKQGDLLK